MGGLVPKVKRKKRICHNCRPVDHCPMCQEKSLALNMVLLGRKINLKQADGSFIYIVNHQDAHTMYGVTVYEKNQSLGTCLGNWVLGYLEPEYPGYLFGYFIRKHKKSIQHVV